jgi:putative selenium metabolism protein SsnA
MIIKNGVIITYEKPNRIISGSAIIIRNGRILKIGQQEQLVNEYPGEESLDARGQLVMPGNICAHTHFYGAFSRGLGIPGEPAKDFPDILQKLWWKLDKSLTHDDVKYSALVCIMDAIRHGTTTLVDHHASPNAIGMSLDDIAQAVDDSGVRASLCYEVTDRDGEDKSRAGIAENERFIRRIQGGDDLDGRLSTTFGLHASLTLSEKTLERCRAAAPSNVGFHIHVAEHESDEYDSLRKCGMRVLDRLRKHDVLGQNSIVVHAVHVDTREITILADTKTWVTHQPRSNMNNAVGVADTEAMLRMGIKVCIGNDGFSNAMWEEWKTVYLLHKLAHRDPRRMNGMDVFEMGVYNNAELAGKLFPFKKIGSLVPEAEADIIIVDYHPFTPLTIENLPWHILFGFNESMVTSTLVRGKVLMQNRLLVTLDEEKICCESLKISPHTWKRFESFHQTIGG